MNVEMKTETETGTDSVRPRTRPWWRSEGVVWGFWVAVSYEAARTAFAWVGS